MPLVFITGPVRSGKSRFAERLARERGGDVTYVATGRIDPNDSEWEGRVAHHRARRPQHWRVVETAVPGAPSVGDLARRASADETLLVDSLGTWLAEEMRCRFEAIDAAAAVDVSALEAKSDTVVRALLAAQAYVVVVAEETGWGIVPEYASGRAFRDVLGRANQTLAAQAVRAYVVIAGFALDLQTLGRPV